tara:strand:+ start:310940 stop:311818 length:879 start_codon:yes stop_codon:yes gene_type:complete
MHVTIKQPFNDAQTWSQRVLSADGIYKQVKQLLAAEGKDLPTTLRRPDIRLILDNNSGEELKFLNPGDHAKENTEIIPADGDSKAVMVMLQGESLAEQMANAARLVEMFDLAEKGLTKEFVHALGQGETKGLVAEAYGPAPFAGQSEKLVALNWKTQNSDPLMVDPVKTGGCAYGARKAEQEAVFGVAVNVFVKGTNTVPECAEGIAMCIAVSEDWETGEVSTRPIVPSVAKEFYGVHYDAMPEIAVSAEGALLEINLKNGEAPIKPRVKSVGYSAGDQSYSFGGGTVSFNF